MAGSGFNPLNPNLTQRMGQEFLNDEESSSEESGMGIGVEGSARGKRNEASSEPGSAEDKKKRLEQERRNKEADQYNRINFAKAYYYGGWPVWKLLDEKISEKANPQSSPGGLKSGDIWKDGLLKEGLYTRVPEGSFNIRLREDPKTGMFFAQAEPSPSGKREFDKAWGQVMDMMASGRGSSIMVIDFNQRIDFKSNHWLNKNAAQLRALKELSRAIRLAEMRGISLRLGGGAENLLASLPKKRADKYRERLLRLQANQQYNDIISGKDTVEKFATVKIDLEGQEKISTDYDGLKNDDEKMTAINSDIEKIEDRLAKLEEAEKALTQGVGKLNELMGKSQADLEAQLQKAQATGRKVGKGGVEKVADRITHRIRDRDLPEAEKLRTAIETEQGELKAQIENLKNQLKAIEAKAPEAEVQPEASEAKPEASEAKPEASEVKLEASEAKPEASEVKPAAAEAQPEASEAKPAAAEAQPEASEVKPAAAEAQPEPKDPIKKLKETLTQMEERIAKSAKNTQAVNDVIDRIKEGGVAVEQDQEAKRGMKPNS